MMDKDQSYVRVGRGLGEFPSNGSVKVFVVSNGFDEFELNGFEYTIWGQMHRFETLNSWMTAITEKMSKQSKVDLPKIVLRMIDKRLIMPWSFSGIEDRNLITLQVSRFGYAHGFANQKWLISDSRAQKSYELTKDQYDVWNAAAGRVMLLEVVDSLMDQRGISLDEAYALLLKHGIELHKLSLWGFEYVDAIESGVQ
ncbi:hypothetical protein PCCS19_49980 [Paenibacillus sp. CCS19]|uniref:hypothetical protein n=1 Tax=Paenibacillus sp. CCS19 TaxID=3158387 RepID=UPI002568015E|nr:hypothetical protein [Paenibacillus cellulosilyticus]GMK41939.1 hypothetical protein PCCS19_49980 [Paenibacillus cellulosilyticus]